MIEFKNNNQVVDMFNAAELWLEAFQYEKDKIYLKMECFDDPSHLVVRLDYYCDHWFNAMLYNIRFVQCINWFINNNKSISELNGIVNDALCGKTSCLMPRKPIEEDDEVPF